MARYYFDMFDGSAVLRDDFGDTFGDVHEAADQAAGLLVDIARDELQNRQGQDFAVVVRNEDERDVYRAALIFRDSYSDPKSPAGSEEACFPVPVPDPVDLIRRSRETRANSEGLARRVRETAASLSEMMQQTVENLLLTKAAVGAVA